VRASRNRAEDVAADPRVAPRGLAHPYVERTDEILRALVAVGSRDRALREEAARVDQLYSRRCPELSLRGDAAPTARQGKVPDYEGISIGLDKIGRPGSTRLPQELEAA